MDNALQICKWQIRTQNWLLLRFPEIPGAAVIRSTNVMSRLPKLPSWATASEKLVLLA